MAHRLKTLLCLALIMFGSNAEINDEQENGWFNMRRWLQAGSRKRPRNPPNTPEPTSRPTFALATSEPTTSPTSELSSFCGVAFISPNKIALIDLGNGNIIAQRTVGYESDSIAVDKINKDIYVIGNGNNPLYKYDISLNNEVNIGLTNIQPVSLDFNELDGMLYGSFGKNIFQIDPLTGASLDIGDNNAGFETALLVNKNGNDVFIMDWANSVLTNNTLINPTLSSTTIINFPLPPGQTNGPDTLDYLNSIPNDNKLVMCWGFDHPLDCYIYDLDTQIYTEILSGVDLLIRGLEILPDTMCTSLTASPTTVGGTSSPTVEPTLAPTNEPTVEPTSEPTTEPTTEPTIQELFVCQWRSIGTGELIREQVINVSLDEVCEFLVPPELRSSLFSFIVVPFV